MCLASQANKVEHEGLWTILTALLITEVDFLGKKLVAADAWGAASAALNPADDAVLAARSAVIASCPPEIANQTLALPVPASPDRSRR